jgi:hypothetical protein
MECDEIKRQVAEKCGLAGIVPCSRSMSDWNGKVEFFHASDGKYTTAHVSYDMEPTLRPEADPMLRMRRVSVCLRNAFGLLQMHGLCCNGFTVINSQHTELEGAEPAPQLHRIGAKTILDFLDRVDGAADDTSFLRKLPKLESAALDLFKEAFPYNTRMLSCHAGSERTRVLHYTALALQLLSVGIMSYTNGHVGPMRPFFMMAPLHKIVLSGNQSDLGYPSISADLVNLTCMSGLVRSPVLAFRVHQYSIGKDITTMGSFDLWATPIDVIDTWGPALLVTSTDTAKAGEVIRLEIGGGVLKRLAGASNALHWQTLPLDDPADPTLTSTPGFSLQKKYCMGSIRVNSECPLVTLDQQSSALVAHCEFLHDLGTSPSMWCHKTLQTGLTVGKFATISTSAGFEKLPGVSVKEKMLRTYQGSDPRLHMDHLNAHWGLEISLCTGVARRVPLRVLLANALPEFIGSHLSIPSEWYGSGNNLANLVNALKGPNVAAWFSDLSTENRNSAERPLVDLLIHLMETGLDLRNNLNVAWFRPAEQGHPPQIRQCFKLHCDNINLWAKILKDTEYCATFACITMLCLEVDSIECRTVHNKHWRNVTELLTTEVCRHVPIDSGRGSEALQPFVLRPEGKYWIGPSDANLTVRVSLTDPPTLELSRSLVNCPRNLQERLMKMRLTRREELLRERGNRTGNATLVTVRSPREKIASTKPDFANVSTTAITRYRNLFSTTPNDENIQLCPSQTPAPSSSQIRVIHNTRK